MYLEHQKKRINRSLLAVILAAGAVTGCEIQSTLDTNAEALPEAFQFPESFVEPHREDLRLAAQIPSFGGVFMDGSVATVYLSDLTDAAVAQRVLAAHGKIRTIAGKYRYKDLDAWFNRLSPAALSEPGIVFVDLDEMQNRLVVGVDRDSQGAAALVRGIVKRLGLPEDAVLLESTSPIGAEVLTLKDPPNYHTGGLMITFDRILPNAGVNDSSVACTLGFNATEYTALGFITNSHCTAHQGGNETTRYYHGSSKNPQYFAYEVEDPSYARFGTWAPTRCPDMCRWSDAARVIYHTNVPAQLGEIARTSGPDNGSLEVVGVFRVIGEMPHYIAGMEVHKVGITTGWTKGHVTRTCFDIGVRWRNLTLLCQSQADYDSDKGDSGSAVFYRRPNSNDVFIVGLHWGSSGTFSRIDLIEKEIGSLKTY